MAACTKREEGRRIAAGRVLKPVYKSRCESFAVNAGDKIWVISLLAAIMVLTSLAMYFVRRFRDRASDDQPGSYELLTNFREMHARGELTDVEYRTIKTRLAAEIQQKFKNASKEGPAD
jgi:uncharacterized membrane protein